MADSAARIHLRNELAAHVAKLGYSAVRPTGAEAIKPEIVRMSPIRGRIVYGETVLRSDLRSKRCHDRLRFFSQRRTRHRSSILFFIGVAVDDQRDVEALLAELDIRSGIRGGHVHVVPIAAPVATTRSARRPLRAARA
jgi:hypothetical protein